MPRGVTIPEPLRETVVRMSAVFSPAEIRAFTTVSERQQSRIMKLWRETGGLFLEKNSRDPGDNHDI